MILLKNLGIVAWISYFDLISEYYCKIIYKMDCYILIVNNMHSLITGLHSVFKIVASGKCFKHTFILNKCSKNLTEDIIFLNQDA